MKPAPFSYVKPTSVAEALMLLGTHPDAVVLAGGQSLAALLNMRLLAPSHLIDIGGLTDLRGVSVSNGRLRLGALLRHRDLATLPEIAENAPLLQQAALHIGHPAIRNRGTLGGSLALADPAAELPACLLALAGYVEARGPAGTRRIAAADFFTGAYETALRADELLTAVEVPLPAKGDCVGFQELARRHGDYALAGLAAQVRIEGGRFRDVRLAFFAVADGPVLAVAAAAELEGAVLSEANSESAAAALGADITPIGQPGCRSETKLHFCRVLLRRVLAKFAVEAPTQG